MANREQKSNREKQAERGKAEAGSPCPFAVQSAKPVGKAK